jgi:hypothetical protein
MARQNRRSMDFNQKASSSSDFTNGKDLEVEKVANELDRRVGKLTKSLRRIRTVFQSNTMIFGLFMS